MDLKIIFEITVNSFKICFLIFYVLIHCYNVTISIISNFLKSIINKENKIIDEVQESARWISESPAKHKKTRIENRNKDILEAWFHNNISCPYASKFEISRLVLLTGIESKKIKWWLNNKRNRSQIKPRKLFTDEDNAILMRFFDNQTNHPGPADLSPINPKRF